jgi:hypothetical protein
MSTNLEHDLRFVAGMFGVEQDPETRALSPSFGWAIVYDGSALTAAASTRPA